MRLCQLCGADIDHRGNVAKFCESCAVQAYKYSVRRATERKTAKKQVNVWSQEAENRVLTEDEAYIELAGAIISGIIREYCVARRSSDAIESVIKSKYFETLCSAVDPLDVLRKSGIDLDV